VAALLFMCGAFFHPQRPSAPSLRDIPAADVDWFWWNGGRGGWRPVTVWRVLLPCPLPVASASALAFSAILLIFLRLSLLLMALLVFLQLDRSAQPSIAYLRLSHLRVALYGGIKQQWRDRSSYAGGIPGAR
jgi:hypothetical protein